MVETWYEAETCCKDVLDEIIFDDLIKLLINCKTTLKHADIGTTNRFLMLSTTIEK